MKHLTMLTIATIATIPLIAVAGGGTATATVLCKTTSTPCPFDYEKGTNIHAVLAEGGPASFDTDFGTAICGKSTMQLTTTTTGGVAETVVASIAALTFEECSCPVTVVKAGQMELHHIPLTDDGTITFNGTEITKNCKTAFGTLHCVFRAENAHGGTFTGGNSAVIDVIATLRKSQGGILCPAHMYWTGAYSVTDPGSIYVESF